MFFSIYLAYELGFISLPFLNGGGGTPTQTSSYGTVPNLTNLTYQDAVQRAKQFHFNLELSRGPQDGIVNGQNPLANTSLALGGTISVTTTNMTKVPNVKPGDVLEAVEQTITNADLKWVVQKVSNNPALPANYVTGVNPKSGASVPIHTTVTIFVTNYNVTPTPSSTPSPSPSPKPSPSPTPSPSPSPGPSPSPT